MELSQSPQSQATNNTAKPRMTSFFPLQKLKGTQPALKTPAMHLAHLEEESAEKDKDVWKLRPQWYQWGYRGVHGAPCKGHEGCLSGGKALLSL